MQSEVIKRIRYLAAVIAVTSVPAIAAAQGTSSPTPQTTGNQVTAQPNSTSTGGVTGSSAPTTAAPSGYGDPNATSVSPPMGTPSTDSMITNESGGDVDTDNGGGSKAGWLGLLGLVGLIGLRGRGHRHVDVTTSDNRRV
jgi:MYXO-CTERM domain-containing protein